MTVNEVIAANKRRQARARELNQRAGRALFKVYSSTELVSFVVEHLGGAKRQAEITQPELLLLPELDSATVDRVLQDNPDEITVCGRSVRVQYGDRSNPVVRIDFRGEQAKDWLQLTKDGVCLPGGREVVLYSAIDGYGYYVEALSSKFPAKARECLNVEMWQRFEQSSGKPKIILPDPAVEISEVSAVHEHQYGTCSVTAESLVAFGTVTVKSYRYYPTDPYFEGKWFRNRQDAEAARAQSVEKLSTLKRELAEQKVLVQVRQEADALKSELYRLYISTSTSVIGDDLKTRLYNGGLSYLPADLDGLRNWVTQWTPVLSEVRQILAQNEISRNRKEERSVESSTVRTPSSRRERDQRRKPSTESGPIFGQGSDAWGALDGLKF